MNLNDFLNSNLLQTIATILAAFIAYLIYLGQRADYKRGVAKSILQEIRYAEKQIKIAKERNNIFLISNTLLPTNNWYSNVNLFINDLEETDRDSISDFYSKVTFLDKSIGKIAEVKAKTLNPISTMVTPTVSIPSNNPINAVQFQLGAEVALQEITDQVEFLYNTPAANKLRELSKRKWYQL